MTKNRLGSASTAALRQYLRAAQDYGIEAENALIQNDLPTGILDNSISRVTGTEFQRLIRWLVDACNDPIFGLKSGKYVQPGSYSIFGYMIMNCRSAREALHMTPMYERIVGDMGVTKLEKAGNRLAVRWICQYDDETIIPHMIDNVLLSWTQFARYLADLPEGKPYCVELERAKILADNEVPKDVVTMNSKVEYTDVKTGKRQDIQIVYPVDSSPAEYKISILAPLASALIGLRVGQEINWKFPSGETKRLRVSAVKYQPEAEGDYAL